MNQISRSDLKISASERRARKSILLALAQIRQAVDHQLQVLSECADGVDGACDEKSVRSSHVRMCNEMSKMQAIVSRLDGLTSELCAHDSELITSEIESVRQHILRSTSRIYRSTAIPIPLLADPDHDAERVRDEESDNNAVRKVCDNGSSVMDLESEVADKKMELHSCTRLETDVRDLNDVVNKFSRLVWSQKETTDRVEGNVLDARDRLHMGAVILSKISKAGSLPLIGAAIGTAVAGPIGLVLGFKVAAVACVGSATAGYLGGKAVARKSTPPAITESEDEARDR